MDKCKVCNGLNCEVGKYEHTVGSDFANCPACIANSKCLERDMSRFWVVWCENSDKPITTKYTSLKQAQKVKTIMEEKNPGSVFHIMEKVND